MRRRLAALAAVAGLVAAGAQADTVYLKDGDRITGRVLSRSAGVVRLQTPYGRIVIPRAKIERIAKAGEEVPIVASAEPAPAAPPPHLVRLILIVMGKSFWSAWDAKEDVADIALRLEVRLDEHVVATFVDRKPDPGDMPNALVNTFSYAPGDVEVRPGPGARVFAPEVRPGRIVLKADVPQASAVTRRLRLAYQANAGTPEAPAWRDLVEGSLTLPLQAGASTFVQVRQDRGQMEFSGFSRRRMKKVETFVLGLSPE